MNSDMKSGSDISPTIRLNGVTRTDRLACTAKIRDIIVAECQGWIEDFYQYSNASLCLHFGIPARTLPILRSALSDAGVSFGPDSQKAIQEMSVSVGNSADIPCTLQITFVHNEPDLRRNVPAIPG